MSEIGTCSELIGVMVDDLAGLLHEPCDDLTATWMLRVLDALLESLAKLDQLENDRGYLADVLELFPNWHPQVQQLRQQRDLLHTHLREIRERIAREPDEHSVVVESRRQIRDWVESYRQNEQRERLLIQDAFTLDVGEGD